MVTTEFDYVIQWFSTFLSSRHTKMEKSFAANLHVIGKTKQHCFEILSKVFQDLVGHFKKFHDTLFEKHWDGVMNSDSARNRKQKVIYLKVQRRIIFVPFLLFK